MADESDSDMEKTEEPTQHRIDEFRKRGEVASSKELTSVLVLSASVLTLALSSAFIFETMFEFIEWLYTVDLTKAFQDKQFSIIVEKSMTTALVCAAPVCLVSICIGVISNVAQIGFLYSPEVLTFKPERINPVQGFKKLFAMRSVVEALKGFFKFLFILSIVYFFMKDELVTFKGYLHVDFISGLIHGKEIIIKLTFYVIIGLLVIAMADFAYQKYSYHQKLKMTKEEAKKEHKEQEGNPEVKQRIKSIQREMSQKRMMQDIPKADVIVTNPTHISVALKYDSRTMISPEVIAKGADTLALRIREIAKEHDVPIVENIPLARGMYKSVKVGGAVPRELYKAVAEVLAFVYKLKRRKKALSSGPTKTTTIKGTNVETNVR